MSGRFVEGGDALRARFKAIPAAVREAVAKALEQSAEEIVQMMRRLAPNAAVAGGVGWTWGDAPAGSIVIGRVRSGRRQGATFGKMQITIFSAHFTAGWWEFGTAERFHKSGKSTGQIVASPYFFPSYRALARRARSRAARAMNKAAREAFGRA